MRDKPKLKTSDVVAHIVLAILSIIWILPLLWLLMQAMRGEAHAYTSYLFPKEWTFSNFTRLFTDTKQFNYPRWFLNTFVVAVLSCVISTFFVLCVSFAFSRIPFKAKRGMINLVLVMGLFPGFMSIIAIYNLLKAIGLAQSLASLVMVYSGGAGMGYYISKGFFDTMPRALDESASIDGATRAQIMWKIILPMSAPIITYTILTAFIAPWLDYILASVIMKDNYNNYTIAVGLYKMLERETIDAYFTRFCAGAVVVATPITLLFIKMQKYYVGGVTGGAVKG